LFDFTSQTRTINIRATLLENLTTYDDTYPGTGSILDQIEDLLYIMSGNWCTTDDYLQLYVPYPAALNATHDLTLLYPDSGNTDYALDQASVPTGETPSGSGVTRASADKVYYVYPQSMNIERDEASVNRVHVTLQFTEVGLVVKI